MQLNNKEGMAKKSNDISESNFILSRSGACGAIGVAEQKKKAIEHHTTSRINLTQFKSGSNPRALDNRNVVCRARDIHHKNVSEQNKAGSCYGMATKIYCYWRCLFQNVSNGEYT